MSNTYSKIRVVIADDHAMFRKGVIKLLDADRYEFLFEAENGEVLISKLAIPGNILPDIIIMDIEMPGMNGFIAMNWLKENYPDIKVLVVSMVDTEDSILKMLKLGVKGYLSKEMEPEDLHAALQSIMLRDYYYTDFVTNKLIHSLQNDNEDKNQNISDSSLNILWSELNKGQKEFVKYGCTELTYDEIAKIMHVSPKTIDGYRDVVFQKFNLKNRVGLVLFAIRNGLVSV